MKLLFSISLSIAVLLTGGCATQTEVVMKNDKGETRYCYVSGGHPLVASKQLTDCMNDAGAAGFKKVN